MADTSIEFAAGICASDLSPVVATSCQVLWSGSLPVVTTDLNSSTSVAMSVAPDPRKTLQSTEALCSETASLYCQIVGDQPP